MIIIQILRLPAAQVVTFGWTGTDVNLDKDSKTREDIFWYKQNQRSKEEKTMDFLGPKLCVYKT